MKIKAITAAIALAGFFAAAFSQPAHAQEAVPGSTSVTVASGDTLSKIAGAFSTTYVRLFDANAQIDDPDVIYAGQVVHIPAAGEQLPDRPLPGDVAAAAPVAVAAPQPAAVAYAPQPQPAPAVSAADAGLWDRLAQCESSGNWSINTGNGFYGGLQFTLSSWNAVGGSGYPHLNSREEQIRRAELLRARQGWNAWPACARQLGLL